jgi:hypothetical protein
MKKTITITTPDSWKDITLKQYLALHLDMENYKDDIDAQDAFVLNHLCNLTAEEIQALPIDTYGKIKDKLQGFMTKIDLPLERFIKIGDVEYGFEPNLSKMTYGAYADITKYETLTIDKNWAKIMSILYRPIETKKKNETYTIKPYDGIIDEAKWLEVSMDVHFGCLFFFVNLLMDLLNSTLNSMIAKGDIPANLKQTLERSGKVMQQLLNLQEVMSEPLTK